VDGIYLEGEPFDYEVFCSPPHVFDAKESKTDRWSLGNAKPHQVKALLDCRNSGAEAYFLVLFPSGLRRFDAEQVRAAMAEGKKTLRAEEGEVWEWEQFLS
jgi:penicillin-binding protein-related factor A (putative recombinase)